tara:strand:+ start:286 stop:507 length:222 start_codon:yes stop_codon:yes gene_type:complete
MSIQNFDKWSLNALDLEIKGYFDHTRLGCLQFKINGKFYSKKIFHNKAKGSYINLNRISYNVAELLYDHRRDY